MTAYRYLAHRPHYSARLMPFGSHGPSESSIFSDTPPKCLDRDCVERRWTATRHDNVYRSVREKHVVYRQRVLQLSDIPGCCFTSI